MKFALVSLLPLLVAANTVGDRDVTAMKKELDTVDIKSLPSDAKISNLEDPNVANIGHSKTGVSAAAGCAPGYPLYCLRYGWCCPSYSPSCCPRSCCLPGTRFCGTDGNCYR
ncbi:hypothetical protein A9K55_008670 [Cordyceps militaris]|uniref:Uncharacterized protein n=1 Tax=Cordyceps militaris TaxID=73501 RepID=A0A2H4SKE1_CORMI|nr:hypothetical protein A9K55_008670 [Cordyceps militaris]